VASRPASNAAAIAASRRRALSPMRVERIGGMRQTSWLDGLRIARVFGVRLGEVAQ